MRRRRARAPGGEGWHAAIDEHCRRFLGPWPTAFGEIVPSSEFRITIYPHAAGPSRPFQTVRTAGTSDYPMHVPPGSTKPRRCELLTYIPADWDLTADEEGWWPAALLKLLGQFVHEHETSFDVGHTVERRGDCDIAASDSRDMSAHLPTTQLVGGVWDGPWFAASAAGQCHGRPRSKGCAAWPIQSLLVATFRQARTSARTAAMPLMWDRRSTCRHARRAGTASGARSPAEIASTTRTPTAADTPRWRR